MNDRITLSQFIQPVSDALGTYTTNEWWGIIIVTVVVVAAVLGR